MIGECLSIYDNSIRGRVCRIGWFELKYIVISLCEVLGKMENLGLVLILIIFKSKKLIAISNFNLVVNLMPGCNVSTGWNIFKYRRYACGIKKSYFSNSASE